MMKIVIIGGVVGGVLVVVCVCWFSEDVEIIMFECGFYVFFVNCGLLYYIGGDIKECSNLLL